MPRYSLRKCARCGADARMTHTGVGVKARYTAECTENGHMHRTRDFQSARVAARQWNAEQEMIERGKGRM